MKFQPVLARTLSSFIVFSVVSGIAISASTQTVFAQDDDASAEVSSESIDGPNTGKLHFSMGSDFTTKYYFRGIYQEDDGFIAQPWAELNIDIWNNDEVAIGGTIGIWNSFHSEDATGDWYEADLYAGLNFDVGDLSVGLGYTFYESPDNIFSSIEEVSVSVSFDDSEHLGKFALAPYATVAYETGTAAADGGEQGTYLELGVSPGFDWDISDKTTVTVAFPLTLGLSIDDYYEDGAGEDETFGYFDAGIDVSVPLPFGTDFGAWTLSGGIHILSLGDHTETYNGGDGSEIIGTIGFSIDY